MFTRPDNFWAILVVLNILKIPFTRNNPEEKFSIYFQKCSRIMKEHKKLSEGRMDRLFLIVK